MHLKPKGAMGGRGLYKQPRTCFLCLDWLATERYVSLSARGFHCFTFYILLELRANFTGDTFQFFYFFFIHQSYEERKRRKERKEDGGEARGEGEGRWRRKVERTEERTEEETEERIEDTEEGLEVTEEACEEDERCEKESECHSAAKRARVCATFTDSQEHAIVEFVKEHPELYKEHGRFHDRQKKKAL